MGVDASRLGPAARRYIARETKRAAAKGKPAGSGLEARFGLYLRELDVPPARRNVRLPGMGKIEADFLWWRRAGDEDGDREPGCTGVTARWCPVHGDCTCEPCGFPGEVTLNDDDCPLHGPGSHGCEDAGGSTTETLAVFIDGAVHGIKGRIDDTARRDNLAALVLPPSYLTLRFCETQLEAGAAAVRAWIDGNDAEVLKQVGRSRRRVC